MAAITVSFDLDDSVKLTVLLLIAFIWFVLFRAVCRAWKLHEAEEREAEREAEEAQAQTDLLSESMLYAAILDYYLSEGLPTDFLTPALISRLHRELTTSEGATLPPRPAAPRKEPRP